ncbi:MAG: hypothetical protein JSS65_00260 [Armatimonadetes bacterium]|nr:hypothetical protein [Armatimonadota bacterium]
MDRKNLVRTALVGTILFVTGVAGAGQIKQAIKIIGVAAVVDRFGGDINKELNKLTGHEDTSKSYTKVVPILTVGLRSRGAIGAAQVMGSKANVEKVRAVASPEIEFLGEVHIRALIPISTTDVTDAKKLKVVDGVGVSGIVDLKV